MSFTSVCIGIGLALFVGACGWYLVYHRTSGAIAADLMQHTPAFQTIDTTNSTATEETTRAVPSNCGQTPTSACVEYRSGKYHFSIFHSNRESVQTYDESGGAMTLTFEDMNNTSGFQIFIVPYSQSQVTPERFKQDEPSGIRTDLTPMVIDGVTGAAFNSKDPLLGDTYEVWFVHDGYLYEITTLKSLTAQLQAYMQTWSFI